MAEETGGGSGGVPTHPIVDSLMPEPGGERRVALVGYPGPSSNPESVRLYVDLTFKTYLEFPVAAVVKTVPAQADDENSPTVVIVDPKTKVDQVTTERTSGDAAFLSGSISSSHYGAAQAVGGTVSPTIHCICITGTVHHQTWLLGCTTVTAPPQTLACPPGAAGAPNTLIPGCTTVTAPPHTIGACPPAHTHLFGCTTVTAPPPTLGCQAAGGGMPGHTMLFGCTTVTVPPHTIAACPPAGGAQGGATLTLYGCLPFTTHCLPPTLNCQGGGAGMAQANVGVPACNPITHTLATLCTQNVGGPPPACHNITHTAATTCTQAVAGAAQAPANPGGTVTWFCTPYCHGG